eukprot:COSAG01_NODE_4239_length_5213_cov_3.152914_1_plen_74_part_00
MEKLYDPKMNQREFMLKALQSEDKLKPRDVLAFWKHPLPPTNRGQPLSTESRQKHRPQTPPHGRTIAEKTIMG